MNPPIPPALLVAILLVVTVGVIALLVAYLAMRSRQALRKPPPPRPARRTPWYLWVAFIVVTMSFTYASSGRTRDRDETGRPARSAPGARAWLLPGGIIAAIGIILFASRDRLTARVVKLLNDKKFDEAHALVRRALERRPPVEPAPPPAVPRPDPSGEANPWAPPRASAPPPPDPRGATWLNLMGAIEASRERWAEAIEYHRRAERIDASNPIYRFNVGLALTHLGREEEGLEVAREALLAMPEVQPVGRASLGAGLATRLVELGRLGAARRLLDDADGWAGAVRVFPRSGKKPLLDRLLAVRAKLEAAESAESIELG